jgi:ParB family chromosome partitioning protein
MSALALRQLPIGQLLESPLNPRKHYDAHALEELAESIRTHGVLTPLTVRSNDRLGVGKFEIGAGHRRYRAAKIAGYEAVSVYVRDLDDTAFLELLTIDNLQRDNLHPMEEAQGFSQLMKSITGYDVAKIAERCNRSHQYVYDRLRLLKLIPKAQDLFLDNRFPLSHAILLARLSPADQERAINPDGGGNGRLGGLFLPDYSLFHHVGAIEVGPARGPSDDEYADVKPVSLGEFQRWIDEHVRFDTSADVVPDLFPETARAVAEAEEEKQKVVHITRDYRVADDARDATGRRTYGAQAWKRADGELEDDGFSKEASKCCDHAVLGVVVAGRGRGETFNVCVDKKKCAVHWPEEVKAAKQNTKLQDKASRGDESAKVALEKRQAAEAAKQKAAAETRARVAPSLIAAVRTAIDEMAENKLCAFVWSHIQHGELTIPFASWKKAKTPTSAARLLRLVVAAEILGDEKGIAEDQWCYERLIDDAKKLGVNVEKIVRDATPAVQAPAKAKKSAPKKPAKRK